MVESIEARYERAYAELSGSVFRFLVAWTNDWSSAQDLTQEAFLRLWANRASLDWERPVLGWLLVVSRRLASNRFRSLRRAIQNGAPSGFPDESVRVRWLDVCESLGKLTSLERASLMMTAIDGWSYGELAPLLDTTEAALRSAVSRARAKLEDA